MPPDALPGLKLLGVYRFATYDHRLERCWNLRLTTAQRHDPLIPKSRGQVDYADRQLLQPLYKRGHRLQHWVGTQHQCRPGRQADEDFFDARIEVERCELQDTVG